LPVDLAVGAADQAPRACDSARGLTGKESAISRFVALPPGAQPVTGPMAIRNFFAGRGRSVRDHKLELVDVLPIGNYAYITSHFTATLVVNEKATPISGSTVRLLERQSDGQWKIKSHIFVRE
jgi:ketosteroid isomerase-like protein